MITGITVFSHEWPDWGKEWRVLIQWTDEAGETHEGCYCYTGSPYTPKGAMQNLTPEVLTEAIRLAVYPNSDGKMTWHALSAEECARRYAELDMTQPYALDDTWMEYLESALYTGS